MSAASPGAELRHVSILASAGSGKTFQVTNRVLRLLVEGADPGSMLASTFTRLAASEIRDRLLARLVEAAVDDAACRALADALGAPLDRARVRALVAQVARQLHRLQVRTLDSLFAALVQCFALELGLPVGLALVDEDEEVLLRAEALRRALESADPERLAELLRLLTEGAEARAVTRDLDDLLAGLYAAYRESTPEAWSWIEVPPGRLEDGALERALDGLATIAAPSGRAAGGWRDDVDQARRGDWDAFIERGIAARLSAGETTYYGRELEPGVVAAYRPLVDHARAVIIARERGHLQATRVLLDAFHAELERLKRERGVMTFADLAIVLADADATGDLDAVRFRLDARLHHVMLDEFQDTSVSQWRVLAPIARDVICHLPPGRTLLCVGDVKQSIYGWRDAVPEILADLPRHLDAGEALGVVTLDRSYRSSPVVIDAVNLVFDHLDENGALERTRSVANAWDRAFVSHVTARTSLPGRVELIAAPPGVDGRPDEEGRLRAAAELVARLHGERPEMTIGVLVRTNASVTRLLYELGPTRLDVPASGRGGGAITDAPAVGIVLDALRLADHPDDSAAAFNVQTSPLGPALGLAAHRDARDRGRRRAAAEAIRARLAQEGIAPAVAAWTAILSAACDPRERRRLLQLVDLAQIFDARGGAPRTGRFASMVEVARVADTRVARIEVMTIHQAKGLQFDAVVLPDLENLLAGRTPRVLVGRDEVTGPVTRVSRWMRSARRRLIPEIEPYAEEDVARRAREGLALLYVAMTRAVHGLFMIVDAPGPQARVPATPAGVVREALARGRSGAGVLWSAGDPAWAAAVEAEPEPAAPPGGEGGAVTFVAGRAEPAWRRGLRGAAPPSTTVRLPLPAGDDGRDHGTVIHALFQQIEWLDDGGAADAVLERAAREAALRRDPRWIASRLAHFRDLLRAPAVADLLTRGGRELEVRRELPFARFTASGMVRGVIDRLVVDRGGARVIDYKTDAIDPSDAPARAESHRRQLEAYRDAAAELLDLDPDAVVMQVAFVGAGRVVTLEGDPGDSAAGGRQGLLFPGL